MDKCKKEVQYVEPEFEFLDINCAMKCEVLQGHPLYFITNDTAYNPVKIIESNDDELACQLKRIQMFKRISHRALEPAKQEVHLIH